MQTAVQPETSGLQPGSEPRENAALASQGELGIATVEGESQEESETPVQKEKFLTRLFRKTVFKRDHIDIERLRREQQEKEESERYIVELDGTQRPYTSSSEHEHLQRAFQVQKNLNEAIVMASEAVNKVLDRGEALQDIESQVVELRLTTEAFMKNATAAQNSLWWKNKKMGFLLGGGSFSMMLAVGFCVWFFLLR
jgi:Synaptobrevin